MPTHSAATETYGRIASMMSRVKSLLLEGVRKSCGPPLEPGDPVIHAALRPKLSIGKIGTPYRRPKGTPLSDESGR